MTELRDQTQQNFEVLDVKYGRISDTMERLIEKMRNERKETRETMRELTDAIQSNSRDPENGSDNSVVDKSRDVFFSSFG